MPLAKSVDQIHLMVVDRIKEIFYQKLVR